MVYTKIFQRCKSLNWLVHVRGLLFPSLLNYIVHVYSLRVIFIFIIASLNPVYGQWTVSSQSYHHPQEVLLAQFRLYVHKGGLKPDSFYFIASLVEDDAITPLTGPAIHVFFRIDGNYSESRL